MALYVYTKNADAFWNRLIEAIEKREIETWNIDSQGDFAYTPNQWTGKAWIRCAKTIENPDSDIQIIPFGIVGIKNKPILKLNYGIYMGRFAEMLSVHLDDYFESVEISSELVNGVDVFE